MIREVIIHTEPTDIPKDYTYDTETPEFYVYRHKYTGDEIHRSKNPPLYVNIQPYINEVLDKIRAEIEDNAYPIVHGVKGMTLHGILKIIDKYKAEQGVSK